MHKVINLDGTFVVGDESAALKSERAEIHAEMLLREKLQVLREEVAARKRSRDPVDIAAKLIEADIIAGRSVAIDKDPRWPK